MLALAHAAGVDTLDTARAYGEAEAVIGRALAGGEHPFKVVTKLSPGLCEHGVAFDALDAAVGKASPRAGRPSVVYFLMPSCFIALSIVTSLMGAFGGSKGGARVWWHHEDERLGNLTSERHGRPRGSRCPSDAGGLGPLRQAPR